LISRLKLSAVTFGAVIGAATIAGAAVPAAAAPLPVTPTTWCTYKVINVVNDYLFVYSSRSTSDHIGDFGPGETIRGHHGNVAAGGRDWKYVTGKSENYRPGVTVTGYVHATASGTGGTGTPYLEQLSCDPS
jgi:hypothetical protein